MVAVMLRVCGRNPTIRRIAISSSRIPCRQCSRLAKRNCACIRSAASTPNANARSGNRYFSPSFHSPIIKCWLINTTLPVCALENTLSLVK